MAKVKTRIDGDGATQVIYYCPGCKHNHSVPADRWNWNGDSQRPTLHPSVRHFYGGRNCPDHPQEVTVCHYFVRDGQIQFCDDCPHEYSGKTVEMVDIE